MVTAKKNIIYKKHSFFDILRKKKIYSKNLLFRGYNIYESTKILQHPSGHCISSFDGVGSIPLQYQERA